VRVAAWVLACARMRGSGRARLARVFARGDRVGRSGLGRAVVTDAVRDGMRRIAVARRRRMRLRGCGRWRRRW
jgi:hypothetical protein